MLPKPYYESNVNNNLQILSLGGGVQSTTVALMSAIGELPRLDAAIFADTGWEPKAVYDHMDWLEHRLSADGIPVYRVQAGNVREDAMVSQVLGKAVDGHRWASLPYYTLKVWGPGDADELTNLIANRDENGDATDRYRGILGKIASGQVVHQGGMIRRQCTSEYKIEPIEKFIKRELLGLKPKQRAPKAPVIRQWFGISWDEMQRMRTSPEKWKTNWYPLIDKRMTRQHCLDWLERNGFPRAPRSACIGCPFHHDSEWRVMKLERPDEFEDACQFDEAIRNCGGLRGQVFLHRSCKPLREVDFRNDVDRGQALLFIDEQSRECDSGHCFV